MYFKAIVFFLSLKICEVHFLWIPNRFSSTSAGSSAYMNSHPGPFLKEKNKNKILGLELKTKQ
jgi:hypothetical protein